MIVTVTKIILADGENSKKKFSADEGEDEKFQRRLDEETKIVMRIQLKIYYENLSRRKNLAMTLL